MKKVSFTVKLKLKLNWNCWKFKKKKTSETQFARWIWISEKRQQESRIKPWRVRGVRFLWDRDCRDREPAAQRIATSGPCSRRWKSCRPQMERLSNSTTELGSPFSLSNSISIRFRGFLFLWFTFISTEVKSGSKGREVGKHVQRMRVDTCTPMRQSVANVVDNNIGGSVKCVSGVNIASPAVLFHTRCRGKITVRLRGSSEIA